MTDQIRATGPFVMRLFLGGRDGAKATTFPAKIEEPITTYFAAIEGLQTPPPLRFFSRRVSADDRSLRCYVAEGLSDAEASRLFATWLRRPHPIVEDW